MATFLPGSFATDPVDGLVLTANTGSMRDFMLRQSGTDLPILSVPFGTRDIEAAMGLRVQTLRVASLGAGLAKFDGAGTINSVANPVLMALEAAVDLNAGRNVLLPNQALHAGKVLTTDGTNASWQPTNGYGLTANSAQFTPANLSTYYFGIFASLATTTTDGIRRQYVPKSGTIRAAILNWFANAVAGTNEAISMYVRVNNTTDYLIATVSTSNAQKVFQNFALSAPVVAGDYFEIKLVTPTWATGPTQVTIGGTVYIE